MNYKKFDQGEILRNNIKTYPKNSIFLDNTGSIYIKQLGQILSSDSKNSNLVAYTNLNLLESYPRYNRTFEKNSKHDFYLPFNTNNNDSYANKPIVKNGYLSSSISLIFITSSLSSNFNDRNSITGINNVKYVVALKNTLDWNTYLSPDYNSKYFLNSYICGPNYSITADIKNTTIINIPSVFYGSEIKKGSIKLNFYITGTLVGSLQDINQNGQLIETTGSNANSVAGIVLYSEGIVLLTGSWKISDNIDNYVFFTGSNNTKTISTDNPRWIHWGKSYLSSSLLNSSSFEINFEGTNYISTITMYANAYKNEFNMTNNKTALDHSQDPFDYVSTGSTVYAENKSILFKNTIKTPYFEESGSFKKQSFITKIGIYDKNKKLLGIAKLATPIKKNNEREYTFKLKLDI